VDATDLFPVLGAGEIRPCPDDMLHAGTGPGERGEDDLEHAPGLPPGVGRRFPAIRHDRRRARDAHVMPGDDRSREADHRLVRRT